MGWGEFQKLCNKQVVFSLIMGPQFFMRVLKKSKSTGMILEVREMSQSDRKYILWNNLLWS